MRVAASIFVTRIRTSSRKVHLGRYWLDGANTTTSRRHTLWNLGGEVRIARQARVFGRILNATDGRYTEIGLHRRARPGARARVMARLDADAEKKKKKKKKKAYTEARSRDKRERIEGRGTLKSERSPGGIGACRHVRRRSRPPWHPRTGGGLQPRAEASPSD